MLKLPVMERRRQKKLYLREREKQSDVEIHSGGLKK